MDKQLYEKGMNTRRQVLGDKHIARRQASSDPYTIQQNELVTEIAWGMIWSRPGLPLKVRSRSKSTGIASRSTFFTTSMGPPVSNVICPIKREPVVLTSMFVST